MAPRGRPRKDTTVERTLDAVEKEGLEKDLAKTESMLKATEEFGDGNYTPVVPTEASVNKEKLKANAARLRTVLETQSPRKVTNEVERNKMLARRKFIEETYFPKCIETWRDINTMRQDSPEYRDALRKALDRPRYEPYIAEWKELGKRLDPDDPSINDLDRFRGSR